MMTLVNFVRTRLLIKFPLAAATAAFLIFTGFCARPYVTLQGSTMGTTWTAKFSSADSLENSDVQNIIENKLISLNKVYSTYDPDSELSLLNSAAANEWIKISPALENILLEAVNISKLTNGRYDITVGPIVNLWGFGPGSKAHIQKNLQELGTIKPPEQHQISEALKAVGYNKLKFKPGFILKESNNMYIDLSSIAKGAAIDSIREELIKIGINNLYFEIGGDLTVVGTSGKGSQHGWRIGIEKPLRNSMPGANLQRILLLKNMAMAGSGDYRNFFEWEGRFYSHTVDAKNGYPVDNSIAASVVIAENCLTADAYATAFMTLSKEMIENLAELQNLEYMLILRDEKGILTEKTSQNFESLISLPKE